MAAPRRRSGAIESDHVDVRRAVPTIGLLPRPFRVGETLPMEYVPPEAFGEDYLHFYDAFLTDEVSDAQADRLWRLLELDSCDEVLDVPCGHGRIANGLAARGASVTGLDANPLFLERARTDASARGVKVEYIQGDMRNLPWEERFDLVLNWFSSFGYFDDKGNRAWLREARKTLRPRGRLVIELWNRDAFARNWLPVTMSERDGDLQVDRHRFDLLTGRAETDRFIVRGGSVRVVCFSVRAFTFTELREWLLDAGFHRLTSADRRVRRWICRSAAWSSSRRGRSAQRPVTQDDAAPARGHSRTLAQTSFYPLRRP
jgi:SAM-dependent methyltransferase